MMNELYLIFKILKIAFMALMIISECLNDRPDIDIVN